MRYILIGRGKMGRLIQETAQTAGDEIEAAFGREDLDRLGKLGRVADVVIDFSQPGALPEIASPLDSVKILVTCWIGRPVRNRLLRPPDRHAPALRHHRVYPGPAPAAGVPGKLRSSAVERQLLPGCGRALPGPGGGVRGTEARL